MYAVYIFYMRFFIFFNDFENHSYLQRPHFINVSDHYRFVKRVSFN